MKKKKRFSFFINLIISLVAIAAIIFSGYLVLDKLVVPKYFKDYGIDNMHDLVSMMKTLYSSPKEKDIVKNGFTPAEKRGAIKKLIDAGVPSLSPTELDYVAIADGIDPGLLVEGDYYFTDREIASILDDMLNDPSCILESQLSNLRYLDILNLNVLDLTIVPEQTDDGEGNPVYSQTKAEVRCNFKLDTSAAREQMASMMETPQFLLDMVVPKTLYIALSYSLETDASGDWTISDGHIGVNGRTEKDSKILLNLLLKFIFPEEDEMTIDKFSTELGRVLVAGLGIYGTMRVWSEDESTHGVVIHL